jgi:hypothetical protein
MTHIVILNEGFLKTIFPSCKLAAFTAQYHLSKL